MVIEEDITYGKAGDTELKLDLARPQGDGPFPAIVFIHGGGWSGGNRQVYRGQIQEAATRGYVAVTISYRLMQFDQAKKETTTATPVFPAQIHDAKAAIRWVRAHAEKYQVDPDRIGVTGASAGGHLSLLVGVLTLHGDQDALVPVEQAKAFDDKMKAVGADHTLMIFEGQGHGFGGEHGKNTADATWAFFDQHLKP
jgi:acetyl esterase/lipase